jgi:hypothetical protein
MEFCGNKPRGQAERDARAVVIAHTPKALGGALALLLCLACCRCVTPPDWRTAGGVAVYDSAGVVEPEQAARVEREVAAAMVALGYDAATIAACLRATVLEVSPEQYPCGVQYNAGRRVLCTAGTTGDRIVVARERLTPPNPNATCLNVYGHELIHRILICAGDSDADGDHRRPELWGPESWDARSWAACLRGAP